MQDKKQKYFSDLEHMKSIEPYSLICTQILEICVDKLFLPKYMFMYRNQLDDSYLMDAIFKVEKGKVYQNIIENYIFKFELNYDENFANNSSRVCGQMVNSILK